MKNFNRKIFISAATITGLLVIVSLFGFLEATSGTVSSNFLLVGLTAMYQVLRFPMHSFFHFFENSAVLFCIGFLLNCLFYGLIYERIYSYSKGMKAKRAEQQDTSL